MYLIFDATGIGKAKSFRAPVEEIHNWPRMIHLSWILLGEDLKPIEDFNCLIKPSGFKLTETIAKRCQITEEAVMEKGEKIEDVLEQFKASVLKAKYVFAHNLNLNENIVGAEYIRANMRHKLHYANSHCLMLEGTYYCKIKSKAGGYKWPSLQEMHTIFFNKGYSPSNNARADVIAATRCFIALMKVRAFEDLLDDED